MLLNAADCWPPGLFGLLGEILHCSTFFHLSNFGVMPLMAGSLGLGEKERERERENFY